MTLDLGSLPWDAVGRMAFASLLGAVIGLERRIQAQPAGMRTQMVIAAACCVTMEVWQRTSSPSEAGRFAQAILTGIGFLGGGSILKSGLSVHGITTAATIWASATIGMAAGTGELFLAAALTLVVVAGLLALTPVETLLTRRRELRKIDIEAAEAPDLLDQVRVRLEKYGIRVDEVGLDHHLDRKRLALHLVTSCPEKLPGPELARDLGQIPGVADVRIE